ncbi:copper homeostasis protein CutC [Gemella cuniculi]|uniref:copper homeostasis protein CutC n=1 Tax=Gemella cuniculi TaxID=150240 RepID=UPI000414D15A|nr:copper homeostasis protein CutC [Gemella cuniculi]
MIKVEVCANSIRDCLVAQSEGANRIELVSASFLGGLTPTASMLDIVLEQGVTLPIMCMVRPRGGGFCYSELEKKQMFREAKELLKHGANGIVFGFLTEDSRVDWESTEKMIEICNKFGAESVFHRAFDCAKNPEHNIQRLIGLGCTRILTSGLNETASKGSKIIKLFQEKYGRYIEILIGAGINSNNVQEIVEKTGITQIHGTFKYFEKDLTTTKEGVSFSYSQKGDYEQLNAIELNKVINIVRNYVEK